MKKNYLGLAILASGFAMAQEGRVGVNTDAPSVTLEITPNATNAATTATSHEGILIPRVSRVRAANMGTGVPESTLVYINNLDGSAAGTTVNVDANGFYYFAGGKWVKMGAGSGSSTPATGAVVRSVRIDSGSTVTVGADDYYIELTNADGGDIVMPAANTSLGREVCFFSKEGVFNNGALGNAGNVNPGYGACVISDGSQWVTKSSL